MTDAVNHPPHYTAHPSGIECISIARHLSFNLGNAFKYVWRRDEKGDRVENLKKALWYIQDELAIWKVEGLPDRLNRGRQWEAGLLALCKLVKEHDPTPPWGGLLVIIAIPRRIEDLELAAEALATEIGDG